MPSALIIGAGANVGKATAEAFADAGYSVAVASRSSQLGSRFKHVTFDASKPETVPDFFQAIHKAIGVPSVVIYNAYGAHITKPDNPFEVTVADFQSDLNINATSVYVAARETVHGFDQLGAQLGVEGGTFIFTGNLLNDSAAAGFLPFGMGKTAAAHLIQSLALAHYADKPYKFYYGDQRLVTGKPMLKGLSGPAHAKHYLNLAKDSAQRPWKQTFVEGAGYREFPREELWDFGS